MTSPGQLQPGPAGAAATPLEGPASSDSDLALAKPHADPEAPGANNDEHPTGSGASRGERIPDDARTATLKPASTLVTGTNGTERIPVDPELTHPALGRPSPNPERTIVLCDDREEIGMDPSWRACLQPGVSATWVRTGRELLKAISTDPPEVVLIGIHADCRSGTDALRMLLNRNPEMAVIVYGEQEEGPVLAAAVTRGARGLMLWDPPTTPSTRTATVSSTVQDTAQQPRMTDRQLQIIQGWCDGLSNREISRALVLSGHTVKVHAFRILKKLGARDRAHAVAIMLRAGLLDKDITVRTRVGSDPVR